MIKCYGLCHKNNPPASADSIKLGIRALQSFLFNKNRGEENLHYTLCDLSAFSVYKNTKKQKQKVNTVNLRQFFLIQDSSKLWQRNSIKKKRIFLNFLSHLRSNFLPSYVFLAILCSQSFNEICCCQEFFLKARSFQHMGYSLNQLWLIYEG